MILSVLMATVAILEPGAFPTMDAAAIEGLQQSLAMTHDYEAGGPILQDLRSKRFVIAMPVTNGDSGSIEFPVPQITGYAEVAWFHTHLCLNSAYPATFSNQDMVTTDRYRITGYIVDGCTGRIRRVRPNVTVAQIAVPPEPEETSSTISSGSTIHFSAGVTEKKSVGRSVAYADVGLIALLALVMLGAAIYDEGELRGRRKQSLLLRTLGVPQ